MSYPPGPPNDGDPTPENQPGPPDQGQPPGYGQPSYPPPDQPGSGQQPGYPLQYGQYGYPPAPTTNGKATASLITGISTLVLSWCCGLGIAGVVAIVLGVKARNEIKRSGGAQTGDGMALGGIITGAAAVLFALIFLAFIIVAIATRTADYNVDYGNNSGSF